MRFFAASMTLLLIAGCGAESDYDQGELYADRDPAAVFVALGDANPGAVDEYKLMASFAATPGAGAFCRVTGADCASGSEVTIVEMTPSATRKIYSSTGYIRIDSTAIYGIKYSEGGIIKIRKFKISTGGTGVTPESPITPVTGPGTGGLTWKALLATGDNEFRAWDNARVKLAEFFRGRGISDANMKQLSMTGSLQTGAVGATSKANIKSALQGLTAGAGPNDACLIFMTSHGSPQGFFLRNQGTISPSEFGSYLDATCGNRPTVAIISACYSGVMLDSSTQKPNRIIFTAARKDRTSFGCDSSSTYTYFDECVLKTIPKATDWKNFGEINTACVNDLERQRGITKFSEPQTFIGSEVTALKLPQ